MTRDGNHRILGAMRSSVPHSLTAALLAMALMHCDSTQVSETSAIGKWGGLPDAQVADIQFEGDGFPQFEDFQVLLRMGQAKTEDQPEEIIAHSLAIVQGGRFQIEMRGAREVGLYKKFILLFDLNRNRRCDPGIDLAHVGGTGAVPQPLVYSLNGRDKDDWAKFQSVSQSECDYFDSLMP
jgi:hypothetical protein